MKNTKKKSLAKDPLKPGRGSDAFVLRLPDGVRKQVALVAETTGRSMNSIFIEAITEWLGTVRPNASLPELVTFAEKLSIRLADLEERVHALDGKGAADCGTVDR